MLAFQMNFCSNDIRICFTTPVMNNDRGLMLCKLIVYENNPCLSRWHFLHLTKKEWPQTFLIIYLILLRRLEFRPRNIFNSHGSFLRVVIIATTLVLTTIFSGIVIFLLFHTSPVMMKISNLRPYCLYEHTLFSLIVRDHHNVMNILLS